MTIHTRTRTRTHTHHTSYTASQAVHNNMCGFSACYVCAHHTGDLTTHYTLVRLAVWPAVRVMLDDVGWLSLSSCYTATEDAQ